MDQEFVLDNCNHLLIDSLDKEGLIEQYLKIQKLENDLKEVKELLKTRAFNLFREDTLDTKTTAKFSCL
jgi:hypothetical protein